MRGCASKGAHFHGSQVDTHFCWKGSVAFMGHCSCILEYPCSRSVAQPCLTLWTPRTAALQASLSFTISQNLLKPMSIESMMPPNHLILCRPLLLPPSIFPIISVFSNESVLCIRWPKYWRFSFSISPSNEYSELIFFRIDCFDLLAVQWILGRILQHHSLKASVL